MAAAVDARTLKEMLHVGGEIAVADVREHGEYGEAHLFFCTSLPFSRFELLLPERVPNRAVRLVLYDRDDGSVASRAAAIAEALGYRNVLRLEGGLDAWRAAGYRTFAGVHVPSKSFGELVEHAFGTPSMSAAELDARQRRGEAVVVLDGRPWAEYRAMSIPGGISCPNGELAYRVGELVGDDDVPIVVNCAGRTRSIIGCETLRQFGVPNPVYALRNGTMGWRLEGLDLEQGGTRRYDPAAAINDLAQRRARAVEMARRAGATFESPEVVRGWLATDARTTYLLDVRDPAEYRHEHLVGAVSAPGGQLIQATDSWVGVRGARLVLVDDTEVRAGVCAFWLAQMGYEVAVLAGGREAWWSSVAGEDSGPAPGAVRRISVTELAAELSGACAPKLLDTQSSMAYRVGHAPGARWVIRSRLGDALSEAELREPVRIMGSGNGAEDLVAADLESNGACDVAVVDGGIAAWRGAGHATVTSPGEPPDRACIDYLFFVHDRHAGNLEAAKRYLHWGQGLVSRLDERELGAFRLLARSG